MSFGLGSNLSVTRLADERLAAMDVAPPASPPHQVLVKTARGGDSAWMSAACNSTCVHEAGPRGAHSGHSFTVAVFFSVGGQEPGEHFCA